ncbi:hypothetical protein B0J14DRAFT_632452 [Halenospora varia]|nr:hypothetical protein B0J14DRAFT_632452 [Halenospora varia]
MGFARALQGSNLIGNRKPEEVLGKEDGSSKASSKTPFLNATQTLPDRECLSFLQDYTKQHPVTKWENGEWDKVDNKRNHILHLVGVLKKPSTLEFIINVLLGLVGETRSDLVDLIKYRNAAGYTPLQAIRYKLRELQKATAASGSTCGKCLESLISPLLKFAFFQPEKLYNTIRTNISKAPSGSNAAQQFSRTSIQPPGLNFKYLKAKLFGKTLSKYLLLLPEFYILD